VLLPDIFREMRARIGTPRRPNSQRWHSEGTLRLEAKNNIAPSPAKIAEFEVKNRCKSAEKAKAEHLLCCYFCYFSMYKIPVRSTLEMYIDKPISEGERNNAGSGVGASSRRRPMGFWGRGPDAAAILQLFFPKNTHFWHIIV